MPENSLSTRSCTVEWREWANGLAAESHGQRSLAGADGSLLRGSGIPARWLSSSLAALFRTFLGFPRWPQSVIGRGSIFPLILHLFVFKSYFYIDLFFAVNRLKTPRKPYSSNIEYFKWTSCCNTHWKFELFPSSSTHPPTIAHRSVWVHNPLDGKTGRFKSHLSHLLQFHQHRLTFVHPAAPSQFRLLKRFNVCRILLFLTHH